MEISKLIADNISKYNGLFTFTALTGEDELLLDYLIEDICSYINKPILNGNTIELEKGLYSDSVYYMDYNNPYIMKNYRTNPVDNRIFNSTLIDFGSKNNISFIIKANLYSDIRNPVYKSMMILDNSLIYASNYICTIREGSFKNQKNRYDDMDGLILNIKALIREDRIKKVLN